MAYFITQSHFSPFGSFLTILICLVVSSSLPLNLKYHDHHKRPIVLQTNQSNCALFAGTWVRDATYPMYYQSSKCPIIDPEFNCQMNGRPDADYLKYRWKPMNCELPRFNGVEFLVKMRGKKVMFIGDSLGRNQWQSLICMVSAAVPHTPTQLIRGDPLSTFRFLEHGLSLSFYRAPYLVDIDEVEGKRILRLDHISGNGKAWTDVDVLSFNTGHWWTHEGSLQGWEYMELGGQYYQDMNRLGAMEEALKTWAKWVDTNIDTTRTMVFFQGISPTHYNPLEWNVGATTTTKTKSCYGETTPLRRTTYPGTYPKELRLVDAVIRNMKKPVYLMDITMLSELRKDGHPSIYSGDLTPKQRANPDRSADCSHWCLPGLPDTWNELLYTTLVF